nr:sodium:proline symporter [Pseudomonas sp.]
DRVTNKAFTTSVIAAVVLFTVVRFELLPLTGAIAVFFELCAAVGGGVVIGLMVFAFLGRVAGISMGALATLALMVVGVGFLRDYTVLLGSLTSYGVSAIVCVAMSLCSNERFDFNLLAKRVVHFEYTEKAKSTSAKKPGDRRSHDLEPATSRA